MYTPIADQACPTRRARTRCRSECMASSKAVTAASALAQNVFPATVGCTPSAERSNKVCFTWRSNSASLRETADCASCRRVAAFEMLPSSTAVRNVLKWWIPTAMTLLSFRGGVRGVRGDAPVRVRRERGSGGWKAPVPSSAVSPAPGIGAGDTVVRSTGSEGRACSRTSEEASPGTRRPAARRPRVIKAPTPPTPHPTPRDLYGHVALSPPQHRLSRHPPRGRPRPWRIRSRVGEISPTPAPGRARP